MASISSISSTPNLFHHSVKLLRASPKLSLQILKPTPTSHSHKLTSSYLIIAPSPRHSQRLFAVAEETSVDTTSEAARRLYIGNIPRNLKDDELTKIVEEHGAVEKVEVMYDKYSGRSRRFAFATMKTAEDASAAIEKLNGTEIGGREIKVNITEKPLSKVDMSLLQGEESQFVDSPHKVYVGNIAKDVTTETLKNFFSEKFNVLSAKVSRVPGTSKSTRFGFVTFSSEEDVEAAISSLNNSVGGLLVGQTGLHSFHF
ncbi:small ribosomal subunit protein cS22 isoform X1 [Humulus lupulus]|uniref:small ribosomal subunit protein cS22 isoform X1 n=1 Tax=Humulus lupulus TaxID=3486 RepID=UPI002B406AB8|nr:small ribosomal subunit protein cS22 isoform X1 [Humulus lupulus]